MDPVDWTARKVDLVASSVLDEDLAAVGGSEPSGHTANREMGRMKVLVIFLSTVLQSFF